MIKSAIATNVMNKKFVRSDHLVRFLTCLLTIYSKLQKKNQFPLEISITEWTCYALPHQ